MDNLLIHEVALEKAIKYFGSEYLLGKSIGVSQQQVSYWVQMGTHIKYETAWRIVVATKGIISIDELRPDVKKLNKKVRKMMLQEMIVNEETGELEVAVAKIKTNRHFRKSLGDIARLAKDIEHNGLINPIGIADDLTLICGARRLEAYKLLKRENIPVRFLPVKSILQSGYAENELRKEFSPSERVAIGYALENERGKRQGQRTDLSPLQNFAEVGVLTESTIASEVGFGNRETYRQAKSVTDNGTTALVQAMDEHVVSISTAAIIATLPCCDQDEILTWDKKDIITAGKIIKSERSKKPSLLKAVKPPISTFDLIIIEPPSGVACVGNIANYQSFDITRYYSKKTRGGDSIENWASLLTSTLQEGASLYLFSSQEKAPLWQKILTNLGLSYCKQLTWSDIKLNLSVEKTQNCTDKNQLLCFSKGIQHYFNCLGSNELDTILHSPPTAENTCNDYPSKKFLWLLNRFLCISNCNNACNLKACRVPISAKNPINKKYSELTEIKRRIKKYPKLEPH